MPNTRTVEVPHLGGITAAYQSAGPIDKSKPTVVLVNSMTTSSELYREQFKNKALTDMMNLVAIELLGHGQTRAKTDNWTYWDTAQMNLQVMEKLGIERAFALGTSQGGWVCVRMALLAPERIQGLIPMGTSLDSESERARELGCWNAPELIQPIISAWTTNDATPDFEPPDQYCDLLLDSGFGPDVKEEVKKFWIKEIKANYHGDDGRKRIRMAAINLKDRDSLLDRVWDIRCPVRWLHVSGPAISCWNGRQGLTRPRAPVTRCILLLAPRKGSSTC